MISSRTHRAAGRVASARRRPCALACALGVLAVATATLAGALVAQVTKGSGEWRTRALAPVKATPPLPPTSTYPVQLVLDDDGAETAFGVTSGVAARQFLWLNAFSVAAPFDLREIWVLFPAGQEVTAGDAIDLVIYTDSDADPSNGATLLRTISTTVQIADGTTFSQYTVAPALSLPAGNVHIGVIDRAIVSGATPSTQPAALDTTTSQGRSWVITWSGAPPNPAVLPGNGTNARVDDLTTTGGNWMIRAFGAPTVPIPALGAPGLALLALLLVGIGLSLVRR